MSELDAAAAHFAKALAHWRDLRFMLEIAEERRLDHERAMDVAGVGGAGGGGTRSAEG